MSEEERRPLLAGAEGGHPPDDVKIVESKVQLKRHIGLASAVLIMVGNVIGSGIFVSPRGVTQHAGSVGASLIIWALTGFYNLTQALCYAELGALIPRAGGDYAYIFEVFGPLPAFMCAWIHIVVIASSSCAVIARTAGLYLLRPFGEDCYLDLITLLAVFIIGLNFLLHVALPTFVCLFSNLSNGERLQFRLGCSCDGHLHREQVHCPWDHYHRRDHSSRSGSVL
jgi:amino acid transporter